MPSDSEYECGICKEPGDSIWDGIAYVKKGNYLINVHPECHPEAV